MSYAEKVLEFCKGASIQRRPALGLADYAREADEEIARLTARVEKMEAFITDECLHPQAHPHLKEAARAALEKAQD